MLCRLSVLYRLPLHDIAQWPAAHIRLLQAYLAKQPAPEERVEIGIAFLRQTLAAYVTGSEKPIADFLPFNSDPWHPDNAAPRYSDVDRSFLAL